MRLFVIDSYNGVMSENYYPLSYIPNEKVRHIMMLGLMWMWATIFAVWTDTMLFLGPLVFSFSPDFRPPSYGGDIQGGYLL